MELAKTDLAALPESERNILTLAGARLIFAAAEPHIFEAVTAVSHAQIQNLRRGERRCLRAAGKTLNAATGQRLKGQARTRRTQTRMTGKHP